MLQISYSYPSTQCIIIIMHHKITNIISRTRIQNQRATLYIQWKCYIYSYIAKLAAFQIWSIIDHELLSKVQAITICNTFTPKIKGMCSATNLMYHSTQCIIMRAEFIIIIQSNMTLPSTFTKSMSSVKAVHIYSER